MKKLFKFKPSLQLGVDIQPDAINLVQAKKAKRKLILHQATSVPLPVRNNWDCAKELLTDYVKAHQLDGAPAIFSVPTCLVRTELISLPSNMSDAETEAEIFSHLQQAMPGLSEMLFIDFSRLPSRDLAGADIVYTAVREQDLAPYLDCAKSAGLNIKMIDVDCYALQRALQCDIPILHVKNNQTEFMVFDNTFLLFHQQWEAANISENKRQLIECLQTLTSTFRHYKFKKLMLCAPDDVSEQMINVIEEATNYRVLVPNILPNHLFIASGLAMRELPPW